MTVTQPIAETVLMSFGKYRGHPVSRVPRSYLLWVLRNNSPAFPLPPLLKEAINAQVDWNGSLALLLRLFRKPADDQVLRELVDHLMAKSCRSCQIKAQLISSEWNANITTAYVRELESAGGCAGLSHFAYLQNRLSDMSPTHDQQESQQLAYSEDMALRVGWRSFLPTSVTTLRDRADREAHTIDYILPAIRFPTRPRQAWDGSGDPWAEITYKRGLPVHAEMDRRDWDLCGIDLLEMFPWLDVTLTRG